MAHRKKYRDIDEIVNIVTNDNSKSEQEYLCDSDDSDSEWECDDGDNICLQPPILPN